MAGLTILIPANQVKNMTKISFPTLESARQARNGGIDAMAALDSVIYDAISGLPPEQQKIVKYAFGDARAAIVENLINPAVFAYPALETDQAACSEIAQALAYSHAHKSDLVSD